MMYPRYPNTILFVGEASDAHHYAIRFNLGVGRNRVVNRPFVKTVNQARDLYGYDKATAAIYYEDGYRRRLYEQESGRLRELEQHIYARGFRTVEDWYYGIGFDT